jgi:ferritin-like protein
MLKAIDIWKKIDDTAAIRYRCFERLADGQFCVQSADYYYLPLRQDQVKALEQQFIELFIEDAPDQRSPMYTTIEAAIAEYDLEFADDFAGAYLERQAI